MTTHELVRAALNEHDPAGYIGFERVDVGVGVTTDASIGFSPRECDSEPVYTVEQILACVPEATARPTAFDGADLRESNLAMMIRRLCSMRIDGTFAITEKKRDEALELLRSMGLQGSPLRDTNGVRDTCGGKNNG